MIQMVCILKVSSGVGLLLTFIEVSFVFFWGVRGAQGRYAYGFLIFETDLS